MDAADKHQLELYLDPDATDDLVGHRFSAFLRQNPRALAALDPDVLNAILSELGELPAVEHHRRRLPARGAALALLALAVAVLPLAAQYMHQRGLIQGLSAPALPPVITPFVQQVAMRPRPARAAIPVRKHYAPAPVRHRHAVHAKPRVAHYAPKPVRVIAHHRHASPKRVIAYAPHRTRPMRVRHVWHHLFDADTSMLGARARLDVRGYLHAIIDRNLAAAFGHLGMPATADTSALAELPIVSRRSRIAILGSRLQAPGREQVQADIVTDGREYYEVFYVVKDGAAMRITDRFYIPVNRRAQVAMRSLVQRTH
jgi:hypothetical protein